MHLAAVMDLVLEHVRQEAVHGLLDTALAAKERDRPFEVAGRERFAQRDEAPVDGTLGS